MNANVKKGLRWLVTAVILVFLVMFARTIDWSAAWSSMRNASLPLLAAAIAVNLVSIGIKGIRWWIFLRAAGIKSLGLAMRATMAGAGLNNVLVANGGDAARVVFVSRATGVPSSTVLASLALERVFDPIGFVVLMVIGVLVFDLPPQLEKWKIPAIISLAVIIALLSYFVYATRNAKHEEVAVKKDAPATFIQKAKAYMSGFGRSAGAMATGPRFAAAMLLSLLSWATQLLTFHLAARATHVDIPLAGSLACLLGINIGLLVRATPGNVGFFQFVYALMAKQFGVAPADAIAVSLLIQTLQILPLTALGVALAPEFIFKRKTVEPELEKIEEEIEAETPVITPGVVGTHPTHRNHS